MAYLFLVKPRGATTMKTKAIAYWATTTLIALETLAGGVTDLAQGRSMRVSGPSVAEVVTQLGYPLYILVILGVWKLLGAITLLAPRFPRLKEWAYARHLLRAYGCSCIAGSTWQLGRGYRTYPPDRPYHYVMGSSSSKPNSSQACYGLTSSSQPLCIPSMFTKSAPAEIISASLRSPMRCHSSF